MGILDNLESAWDDFLFESNPIIETNNMGEPIVKNQGIDQLTLDEEVINN
jgi:hypothetical protein